MISKIWRILLAVNLMLRMVDSSTILGYFITPSRSHFIVQDALMRGLAAKGHEVTVISFYPPPEQAISNYTYVKLEMNAESATIWKEMTSGTLDTFGMYENTFNRMPKMLKAVTKLNSDALTHPLVEKIRLEKRFDLVVFGWFFNDYQVGLANHFNCPAIVVASVNAFKNLRDFIGNPSGPAHTPMAMTTFPTRMSFWQRVANFGVSMVEAAVVQSINYFVFEPEYNSKFPPDQHPSFSHAKKNVALVLVTSHSSQGPPMASFPAMVEVGGMHIKRKPDSLPKNIREWLDFSANGVVYFSLGTNINSTKIEEEKLNAILRVFGRLKQRVLWKFDAHNLPGKPDNVMLQMWLPQDDVLAHPNVRLFISHCGKGGVNEARYHGVPILGIPVFADQPANMAEIVDQGWGVPLRFEDLTESTFEAAITEALSNSSYSQVVKKKSLLFRDRPQHPLDTAIYWVEYVIRHKGAKHMQSSAVHLTWYQYHSLDVIALMLVVIFIGFKCVQIAVLFLWRWFRLNILQKQKKIKSKRL